MTDDPLIFVVQEWPSKFFRADDHENRLTARSGLVGSDCQIFAQFRIIEHAYNPILSYILDSDKASCPIICVVILGRIA